MTAAALSGWKWNLPLLVAAGAAECSALRAVLRKTPAAPEAPAARRRIAPAEWIAAAIGAASVLVSAASSLSASATSPDLLLFWGSKAQAFASARTIDDGFLGEPFLRFLHTSYPPLVTNAYAFATIVAGRLSWMGAVATFPLLLAALAVALPAVLRTSVSRRDALAATAFITATFALAGQALDMAGNADMALLFFETLAVALLLGGETTDAASQTLAGLLLAGAAAAKVEGLPFVIAAGGLWLLRRPPRRAAAAGAARIFLPAFLSVGVWFAYGRRYFLFRGYESYGPTLEVHLSRIGLVLGEILRAFWETGAALPWLVPIAALAWIAAARGRLSLAVYPLGIAGVLSLFFVFTYLHGSLDPTLWITWSAGRIFVVVAALLVLAVTAARARGADEAAEEGPRRATPD